MYPLDWVRPYKLVVLWFSYCMPRWGYLLFLYPMSLFISVCERSCPSVITAAGRVKDKSWPSVGDTGCSSCASKSLWRIIHISDNTDNVSLYVLLLITDGMFCYCAVRKAIYNQVQNNWHPSNLTPEWKKISLKINLHVITGPRTGSEIGCLFRDI